jgi:hypothetical protein
MQLSMPKMSMMAATGMAPTEDRVAVSTMKPDLVTPAAPLDESSTPMMVSS